MSIAVSTIDNSAVDATVVVTAQQLATPTTGQTVVMTADNRDRILWLTPAGTIAALTVTLPTEATSRIGQRALIGTSQAITALTVNGATTIYNASLSPVIGDTFEYIKVAANTWAKL